METKITILLILLAFSIIPIVSADIITPTTTSVYFEKDGKAYNENIEFTIKGYGYSYPVGPSIEKKWGTYTPKVVFQFSEEYSEYGTKIYENYYRNYRHIDYYKLEGETKDGKIFTINNITNVPTSCDETSSYERLNCELRINLDEAIWAGDTNKEPNTEEPIKENFWQKIFSFLKRIFERKK